MAESIIESPISVSMVTSDDKDAPRLTLRAGNVQQLQSQLGELEAAGVLVDIGRVAALFQVKARLGAQLGAAPVDPDTDGGSFDNVQAAAKVASNNAAIASSKSVAATPPDAAAPAKKFPAFGKASAKPAATAAAPAAKRESSPPPPAAPAVDGFPLAPVWKKP